MCVGCIESELEGGMSQLEICVEGLIYIFTLALKCYMAPSHTDWNLWYKLKSSCTIQLKLQGTLSGLEHTTQHTQQNDITLTTKQSNPTLNKTVSYLICRNSKTCTLIKVTLVGRAFIFRVCTTDPNLVA